MMIKQELRLIDDAKLELGIEGKTRSRNTVKYGMSS